MSNAIEFRHVSKQFRLSHGRADTIQEQLIHLLKGQWRSTPRGSFWALNDITFAVPRGQSVGLIGSNGSGKSTALKLITGILQPSSGEIVVRGRILALLELGTGMHPDLTGRENIYLNGSLLGIKHEDVAKRFDQIAEFSEIEPEFLDIPVKHYSSGMYVRLAFAVAVHFDPEILVVDEVLAVGDAAFQQKCLARIGELRRAGVTILMVSHDIETMRRFCDHLIWFNKGQLKAQGQPAQVMMEYMRATADHVAGQQKRPDVSDADGNDTESTDEAAGQSGRQRTRWGSGRIRITRVELCDEEGRERSAFTTGSSFNIRLHYSATVPTDAPVFGIAISDVSGTHVTGPNTQTGGLTIPHVEGSGVVTFHVARLPLLHGSFLVSVASHAKDDSELYDYHDRLYPFSVFPGAGEEHLGLMTMGGTWSLDARSSE